MRNIFDQYSQPENRVTHALMTALSEDRALLGRFLRNLVGIKPPCRPEQLEVLAQQYPGQLHPPETELEDRGIPDGWIYDEDNKWCVLIEVKVTARLQLKQIVNHRNSAARQGFEKVTAVAIVAQNNVACPPDTVLLEWCNVYAWLRREGRQSPWAARVAEYLEIAEVQLIEKERLVDGALTMFAGIPFSTTNPFGYLEGKRILKLACAALGARVDLRSELGVVPDATGRGAITGSQGDHIWDFLWLWPPGKDDAFTKYPHLTFAISRQEVSAMVTIPNGVRSDIRNRLTQLGEGEFQKLIQDILKRMVPLLRREAGAVPWFSGAQRRWPSINAKSHLDARIEFDLRTAVADGGAPKKQPLWLSAGYGSFANKHGANYEIQVGVQFPYDRCKKLAESEALDLIAAAWLACKPLIDLARGG